jgi:hypothetical protein
METLHRPEKSFAPFCERSQKGWGTINVNVTR